MIYDIWENREQYAKLHPLFTDGFDYIAQCIKAFPAPGVYEISGKDLFAKVQAFQTRQQGLYETHDRYIDVQYMVEGKELVYIAKRGDLTPCGEYDKDEDAQFYEDDGQGSRFVFEAGSFAVFFPEDAHKPSMEIEKPGNAKKIVLKVRR